MKEPSVNTRKKFVPFDEVTQMIIVSTTFTCYPLLYFDEH